MLNVDLAEIGKSLGPENTKSDISKRMSELAKYPPSPMSAFFCFSGTPLPPSSADVLYEWSLMGHNAQAVCR